MVARKSDNNRKRLNLDLPPFARDQLQRLAEQSGISMTEVTRNALEDLNLNLSPYEYDRLQRLAEESGRNMEEVLRTALTLYHMANAESKKGRSLAVISGEKVVKEILIT
jgi:predicted transcriptional regulator